MKNGKWLQVLITALVIINIAVSTHLADELGKLQEKFASINNRLTIIEANTFTTENGLEIWKEIGDIKKEIAVLQTQRKEK